MKRKLLNLSFVLVTLVAALALAVSPALASDPEILCATDSGTWVGSSSSNGICYFTPAAKGVNCPGKDYFGYLFSGGSYIGYGCTDVMDGNDTAGFAQAGSAGADCIAVGGLWDGDLAGENGTCTYPDGTSQAQIACGAGYDYIILFIGGAVSGDPACVTPGSGYPGGGGGSGAGGGGDGARLPGFGQFGSTTKDNDSGGTLSLSGGKNGSVTFDPGTCAGKCTLGPNLPGGAHDDLPDDAVAWLYFKSVDENGDPGTGTYTVCFNVGDLTSPVIYRYVSGAWVVVASTVSGGKVCTSASGDGAFALGGS